jgi:TPR repeat protein
MDLVDSHLAAQPDDLKALFGRAQLHHIGGQHERAAGDARTVHAHAAGRNREVAGQVAAFIGDERSELGLWAEALSWYRRAIDHGGRGASHAGLAGGQIALERIGDRTVARQMFQAACDAGQPLGCRRAASLDGSRRRRSR